MIIVSASAAVSHSRSNGCASSAAKAYLAALLAHPLLREWETAALAETMIIEADEPRVIYRDKLAAAGRL